MVIDTSALIAILRPVARHDHDASDSSGDFAGGPGMLVLNHSFGLGAGPTTHSNEA